eukprot:2157534-Pyramimonas_sp.AAC.1
MRELLHRHHFAVFNDSLAPTWFGLSGEHSRLDYIFGPVAWIDVLIESAPFHVSDGVFSAFPIVCYGTMCQYSLR